MFSYCLAAEINRKTAGPEPLSVVCPPLSCRTLTFNKPALDIVDNLEPSFSVDLTGLCVLFYL